MRCLFAIAFAQYVRYYFTNLTFTLYSVYGFTVRTALQRSASGSGARFFWILVLFPVLFFLRVDEYFFYYVNVSGYFITNCVPVYRPGISRIEMSFSSASRSPLG